ncbi:MAG: galactokinase [Candidatus Brocadiia bacterium]
MDLVKDYPAPDSEGVYLTAFEQYLREHGPDFFQPDQIITAGRAPARLDVMGGIADYSGSTVFESTLGRGAVVGYQPRDDSEVRVKSTWLEQLDCPCEAIFSLEQLKSGKDSDDYARIHDLFTTSGNMAWAAYVVGAIPVLESRNFLDLKTGGNFLLWSDIPVGVGVASSAAVEVAAMYALKQAYEMEIDGAHLATLAQMVENRVVGAPCGIMDQVTAALGERDKLLALRCQPSDVLGLEKLPPEVQLFGISSRVEHSVAGDAYATARISAFMGLKIIIDKVGPKVLSGDDNEPYLCNIGPSSYRKQYRHLLPESIKGELFLDSYGGTTDSVTKVDPERIYYVRAGTEHPVYENYRVESFIECLKRARAGDKTALVEAGGLMYASHCSYSWNCGLGCPETDLLVKLLREQGPETGIYGAKITGGGSGGTVAVLADVSAEQDIRDVAAQYGAETGMAPNIFDGTSPGACAFGPRKYHLKS